MGKKVKLGDIARIQIGYQQRKRSGPGHVGSHRIIQISDIDRTGRLSTAKLEAATPVGDPARYLVSEGDVLFLSRGSRMVAVPVLEPLENTIASYYFYIVRVEADAVLPEYLAWYINQAPARKALRQQRLGSHVKMIPVTSFHTLQIDVPSAQTQRAVVELERLRLREREVAQRLAEARKRLICGISIGAVRRDTPAHEETQNG